MFAVIRIRGGIGLKRPIKDTLSMLRLKRVNHCVLIPKNPRNEGMIMKVKDFVTWGEIGDSTLKRMILERGKRKGDRKVAKDDLKKVIDVARKDGLKKANIKPVIRLSPPKKGYKPIKHAYPRGALGYRGEKINDLIERMI